MTWKGYAISFVLTNIVLVAAGYLILRIQRVLPFNPNGIGHMEPTLSFNTIISFMTNTNLQHYSGESGLSYMAQMAVITMMMFTSAATGLCVAIAFIRAVTSKGTTVGNFLRTSLRHIPGYSSRPHLSLRWYWLRAGAADFAPTLSVTTLQGSEQQIAVGPVVALESIKHLGTNGGGFMGPTRRIRSRTRPR